MNWLTPIWAFDMGEVLGALVIIVVLIISAIKQVLEAGKGQQAKQPPGGQPNRPQDEIGHFLRNVVEKAKENQQNAKRPRSIERKRLVAQERQMKKTPSVPAVAELVESTDGDRFSSSKFDNRFKSISEQAGDSGEKFGEHAHDTFDHNVGQLASESSGQDEMKATTEVPSTDAAGFAAVLSNAESLRQAIVISEIINRPEERWT